MPTFKAYSEKSKARRALVQVFGIDKDATDAYLGFDHDADKWGLTLNDEGQPITAEQMQSAAKTEKPVAVTTPPPKMEDLDPRVNPWGKPRAEDVQQEQQATKLQAEEELVVQPAPAADAFANLAMSQLTAASNAPEAPASNRVVKIEKNREERNGVKMPSAGGRCREVWDALNNMMTHDEASGLATVPTVADIKAHAERQGWNVNNASIEYYQWRKWHGITGRGKKQI